MPKGVRNSKAGTPARILERIQLEFVTPGAKAYPNSQCEEHPEGIPLPDGVRVRSETAVELRFNYQGERVTETLRLRPTVAVVREAGQKRERIVTLITLGKFNEEAYQEEFPTSKRLARAAQQQPTPPDAYTVGMALDDWLVMSWGGHSPNTREDYVRVIRNQLKPLLLTTLQLPDAAFAAGCHSGRQPVAAGFTSGELESRSGQQFASTSTVPMMLVTEDVPLLEGEAASGRRRRRMGDWKVNGAPGSLPPSLSKSVTRYKLIELPLQCLAQLRVTELTDLAASALRTSLREGGMSVKRVNNLMSPLRQALQRLVDTGVLKSNPFERLKPLTQSEVARPVRCGTTGDSEDIDDSNVVGTSLDDDTALDDLDDEDEPDPLSVDEMLAVLAQFDEAMRNHYKFAFHTGLRTGEVIGLRSSDIDWQGNRVRVRRSLSRRVLKKTKSTKSRWVDLLPPARQALEAQIALLGAPDGWVFPNPVTKRRWANESKLTRRWKAALLKAGVRYRRPYHTRHSYASMMLSAGENLLYVSRQLGHADWRMVQERYARWLPSAHGRAAGSAIAHANQEVWERLQTLTAGTPCADDDHTANASMRVGVCS
jgi:site-specific recombinase XerC